MQIKCKISELYETSIVTLQVGNEVNLILYRNVLRVIVCLKDPNIPTSANLVGLVPVYLFLPVSKF